MLRMLRKVITRRSWGYVILLLAILGLALVAGQASAKVLGPESWVPSHLGHDSGLGTQDLGLFGGKATPYAPLGDAFLLLAPGTGGSVPAPPNGGSVPVGGRF